MTTMSKRETGLLAYLKTFEPARLRAFYVGLVMLVGTLGYSLPAGVDAKVTGVLAAAAVLVPLIQGELTRAAVVAPGNVAAAVDADTGLVVAGPAAAAADGTPVHVITTVPEVPQPGDAGPDNLQVDPPAVPELAETADVAPSSLTPAEQDAAGGDHEPAA